MEKLQRLRRNEDFSSAFKHGVPYRSEFVVIYALKKDQPYLRLGVCVSKKLAKAVLRNRLKRIIKEAFRHMQESLLVGWDLAVLVKKEGITAKPDEIRENLYQLLFVNKILQ
jgi:ribonuclease P protein component